MRGSHLPGKPLSILLQRPAPNSECHKFGVEPSAKHDGKYNKEQEQNCDRRPKAADSQEDDWNGQKYRHLGG